MTDDERKPKYRLRRLKISKVDRVEAGSNPGSVALIYKSREGTALDETMEEGTMPDTENDEGLDIEALRAELETAKSALAALDDMTPDQIADRFGLELAKAEEEIEEPEDDLADLAKSNPKLAERLERLAKAEAKVAAMEEADRVRHFEGIAKSDLSELTAESTELGEVLRSVADAAGDGSEVYKTVERVLRGANAQAAKAAEVLRNQVASNGRGLTGDAEEAITKAAQEIAKTEGVDLGTAMGKVRKSDPDLWASYETERAERLAGR